MEVVSKYLLNVRRKEEIKEGKRKRGKRKEGRGGREGEREECGKKNGIISGFLHLLIDT